MEKVVFGNKIYELEDMGTHTIVREISDPVLLDVVNKVKTRPAPITKANGEVKRKGRPPKNPQPTNN